LTNNKFIKSSNKFKGIYHKELDDKDLTYYINYKLNGKKQWICIGKKSEGINIPYCHQIRNDIINKAKLGDDAPIVKYRKRSDYIFQEIIERYIQNNQLAKKTINAYTFVANLLKDKALSDITPEFINKFKNAQKSEGKAFKTINGYIETINTAFNFAIKSKLYKGDNPCKEISKLKKEGNDKSTGARERFLNDNEVDKLKQTVKNNPTITLFIELSLSTGARLETIMALTKKDIDLPHRIILLKNIKSHNDYKGFMSDSLLPYLKTKYKELKNPNDKLINTPSRTIQRQLKPILDKLFNDGLDTRDAKNRVVIHTLRHTFASHLAIQGIPIFTIMKLLDHKDIKDTLRYAKLAPDNGLKAVKGLWKR
jgi:site-specific recombinase XerD